MPDFAIIPAHNEEENLAKVLEKTKQFADNIIVVDDGSTDGTFEQAKRSGVVTLRHRVNLGKGAALKTGCDYAVKQGAEKIVVLDADGQHDPQHIPVFLSALEDHDIVFGYRKVPDTMPLVLRLGNQVINQALSTLHGIRINDTQCGYRAFTSSAYRQIRWEASDYYVETEMTIRAGRKKLKYTSIPIETIYADKYKGTTVLDGVMIVAKMMGWRLLR